MSLIEYLDMKVYSGNFRLRSGHVELDEVTAPGTPAANKLRFYSKDKSGASALYYKNDAGTEFDLSLVGGAALTRVDDTNVTLTLGGSPTTALVNAASLTLGWTGLLAASRGGTGKSALGNVTAGSTKISLGGTPTGAAIEAFSIDVNQANLDHGSIGGLADDDHSQYPLLAGRNGGQTLIGGTAASNNLVLRSTSHATLGQVQVGAGTGRVILAINSGSADEARLDFLEAGTIQGIFDVDFAASPKIMKIFMGTGGATMVWQLNANGVMTIGADPTPPSSAKLYISAGSIFLDDARALRWGDAGPVGISADLSPENLFLFTSGTNRVAINGTGQVGIGLTTSLLAQLHTKQPSTTGAIPVLALEQLDVSEQMIDFITTIGVGNAIEAIGAKTLTTTHFIKVRIPGSLDRYIPCGTIA